MSRIEPEVEAPTREILGHTLRVEIDELGRVLDEVIANDRLPQVLGLNSQIAAAVCVDLCDGEVPTSAALRDIAASTEQIDVDHNLKASEVQDFLERVVFGHEQLEVVLDGNNTLFLPFAITSNLLGSSANVENGQQWWDYLDAIETAIESAPEPG